jgi:hypothetical protein
MVAGVGDPRAGYGGPVPGEPDPGRRVCSRRRRRARAGAGARPGRRPARPAEIERYVQNFEIADEQVASDRYLAQLTVGYQPDAVRELLQDHGLSYTERVSEPVVILPVYRTGEGAQLWPENNPWWQAWANHLDSERLLRLVLPLGDLQDMAAVTPDRAMAGDTAGAAAPATTPSALELEMRRGGVGETNPPETFVAAPGQTLDDLMAEAVVGVQNSLDEQWKSANLLRYDQRAVMVVDIPIAQLSDWVEISRGLDGLTEVTDVEVATFARDKVRAQISYIGDQLGLEEALRRVGLALSREGESWRLLPMGARPSPGEPASATSTSS